MTEVIETISIEERKRIISEKKAERELKLNQQREIHALEGDELSEQYETEIGPKGQKFDLVDCENDGWIVVRRGPAVTYKRFMASAKVDDLDKQHEFVVPNLVHPGKDEFNRITSDRPGLLTASANALIRLFGMGVQEAKKG